MPQMSGEPRIELNAATEQLEMVFEGTGIKIVSDLPFLSQCETVVDANNVSLSKSKKMTSDIKF